MRGAQSFGFHRVGQISIPVIKAASFLGLHGVVVKSHGGADKLAFYHAIHVAIEEARNGVLRRIAEQLEIEHIQALSVKETALENKST